MGQRDGAAADTDEGACRGGIQYGHARTDDVATLASDGVSDTGLLTSQGSGEMELNGHEAHDNACRPGRTLDHAPDYKHVHMARHGP